MLLEINVLKLLRERLLAKLSADELAKLGKVVDGPIFIKETMRSCGGKARYSNMSIELNGRLLRANPSHIESTFAHELAHLVSFALYGIDGRGHGRLWKRTMKSLGYTPDRTHDLDTSALSRRRPVVAIAICGCREYPLKALRVNKIRRGVVYKCLACHERLTIKGETPPVIYKTYNF